MGKYFAGSYNVFGTSAALKTLTNAYVADSKSYFLFRYCEALTLECSFTPGGNGEFLDVQILLSNDPIDATPTNFYVWAPAVTTDAAPATVFQVSSAGLRLPMDIVAPAASTNYKRSVTINPEGANWCQVKAKSSASGTYGTAWVRATAFGN
jgi:hypothetical protein